MYGKNYERTAHSGILPGFHRLLGPMVVETGEETKAVPYVCVYTSNTENIK